jgi:O-antigen/teichoic acid export membrane protein
VRKPLGALTKNVAIYGMGDIAITAVNLLLLPWYLDVLSAADMGAFGLLIVSEAIIKIAFRWGLDGAFMRYYLDRAEGPERQRLASSLYAFLAVASGTLLAGLLLASPVIARYLFEDHAAQYLLPLQLVFCNTFILTFTFVPYHVMRMSGQALAFSIVSFGRSLVTLLLRIWFVLIAGYGITGMMVADVIVTLLLLPVLWPWTRPLLAATFSRNDLLVSLRFGLPRLPHGLAQQAFDAGNKLLFNHYVPLSQLGVYQIATTLGQSLKFFLSAFETGWAPFYYETARQPDAKVTLAKIVTYGVAVLVLLVAGLTAITNDLVRLIAPDNYQGAATVVPLIALGIAFQGVYLLTSIGLNLTSQTKYYPLSTIIAAIVGLGSGVWLMPRLGAVGAAVAFLLSYVTLALVAGRFAQQHYPMRLEHGRLARVVLAGVFAAVAGLVLPAMTPLAGVLARGVTTTLVFGGLLWAGGFLRPTERALIAQVVGRRRLRTGNR